MRTNQNYTHLYRENQFNRRVTSLSEFLTSAVTAHAPVFTALFVNTYLCFILFLISYTGKECAEPACLIRAVCLPCRSEFSIELRI